MKKFCIALSAAALALALSLSTGCDGNGNPGSHEDESGVTDTIPKDTIPKDTLPKDTIPKDTIPGDTIRPACPPDSFLVSYRDKDNQWFNWFGGAKGLPMLEYMDKEGYYYLDAEIFVFHSDTPKCPIDTAKVDNPEVVTQAKCEGPLVTEYIDSANNNRNVEWKVPTGITMYPEVNRPGYYYRDRMKGIYVFITAVQKLCADLRPDQLAP